MSRAEDFAAAIISNLEGLLGKRAIASIQMEIEENYFGKELSLASALVQRPDLFEKAFMAILGSAALAILELAINAATAQLDMGVIFAGLKPGGLAECLTVFSKSDPHS